MYLSDLIQCICTRPVSNIQFTCNEHVEFYTQWISSRSYIIYIIKHFEDYSKKDTVFFIEYSNKNEVPYILYKNANQINAVYMEIDFDISYSYEECILEPVMEFSSNTSQPFIEIRSNKKQFIASIVKTLKNTISLIVHREDTYENWKDTVSVDILGKLYSIPMQSINNVFELELTDNNIKTEYKCNGKILYILDYKKLGQQLHLLYRPLHMLLSNQIQCIDVNDRNNIDTAQFTEIHDFSTISQGAFMSIFPYTDTVNTSQQLIYYDPGQLQNTNKQNSLEAICILTTSHEIKNGLLLQCLQSIYKTCSHLGKCSLDLQIIVNNSHHTLDNTYQSILIQLQNHFRRVFIHNANISPENDIYAKKYQYRIQNVPSLGYMSGPNELFFYAMNISRQYNTILLLETDCILEKDWLEKCIHYVQHSGHFLIAGARYDGSLMAYDMTFLYHLNGVGFYKTGCPYFQTFMKYVLTFIKRQVKYSDNNIAYDMAITKCIFKYLKYYGNYPSTFHFWRFIHRNIVNTSLIVNASPTDDKTIPIDYFNGLYSYAILHKKI